MFKMQAYACQALIVTGLWGLANFSKARKEPLNNIVAKTAVVGLTSLLIGWGVDMGINAASSHTYSFGLKVVGGVLQFLLTSLYINILSRRDQDMMVD